MIQERRDFLYFRLDSSSEFLNEWQDDPEAKKIFVKETIDKKLGEALQKNVRKKKTGNLEKG